VRNHPLNPGYMDGIIAFRSSILEQPPKTQEEPRAKQSHTLLLG
jgi:hypothetical protein